MSVRSGQSITVLFTTRAFATGAATNATGTPTGTLYVNGEANGATVTVANVTTGIYTAQVTLPTLNIGDEVEIVINATVSGVTDNAVIWGDTKDIAIDGSGDVTFNNAGVATAANQTTIITAVGSPMQAGATVAANVVQVNTHTVTGSGTSASPWGPA